MQRIKADIREELRSTDSTREALRAELRSIRDKSRNVNPEKLEEEITQLEYRVQHESLSEQEEKRAHQQIQTLTAARPLARKFVEFDARLKETEQARVGITKRLTEQDGQVKVLDDAIAVQTKFLDDSRAASDSHKEDLPTLQVRARRRRAARHWRGRGGGAPHSACTRPGPRGAEQAQAASCARAAKASRCSPWLA